MTRKGLIRTGMLAISAALMLQCKPSDGGPLEKYAGDPEVRQVVTVLWKGGCDAEVSLYEKAGAEDGGAWKLSLKCDGQVGRNGIDKEREGDKKTPTGDFGIITAFGIKPDPGTSLPYVDVTDDIWCCGDTVAYNRIIDIREVPHECTGEHMAAYSPSYNYGFFLDYNKECEWMKGSAIFFHCTGRKPGTSGCIAVSEEDMVTILRAIDAHARIIVDRHPSLKTENR